MRIAKANLQSIDLELLFRPRTDFATGGRAKIEQLPGSLRVELNRAPEPGSGIAVSPILGGNVLEKVGDSNIAIVIEKGRSPQFVEFVSAEPIA